MGQAKHKRGLVEQHRLHAKDARTGLYLPRTAGDVKRSTWPVCETCHQDVDRVNVEDVSTDEVTIRAWCHGEEAVLVVKFPYSIQRRSDDDTWEQVRMALNSATFFSTSIVL